MNNLSINATLSLRENDSQSLRENDSQPQRENDSQSLRENDSQPQRDDDSQSQREDGYQSQRDDDSHNFLKGQRESMVLQLGELGTTVSGLKTTNREQETTIAQQGITITGLNLKYENLDLEHNDLKVQHNDLKVQHDDLKVQHNDLKVQHNDLKVQHNDLNVRFNASETTRQNISALVMAFDLIKLFRSYGLSMYDWNAVTVEYKSINDRWENELMSADDLYRCIKVFNVTYPTPPNIAPLSDIIGLCQDRHTVAHSGQIKTIVKQRNFIDECQLYFTSNDISESISGVCIPILEKMSDLKKVARLKDCNFVECAAHRLTLAFRIIRHENCSHPKISQVQFHVYLSATVIAFSSIFIYIHIAPATRLQFSPPKRRLEKFIIKQKNVSAFIFFFSKMSSGTVKYMRNHTLKLAERSEVKLTVVNTAEEEVFS